MSDSNFQGLSPNIRSLFSTAPQACGHMLMHAHMIPRRPAWGLCKPQKDRLASARLPQTPKASAMCEGPARELEGGLMQARLGVSSAHGVSHGAGRGRCRMVQAGGAPTGGPFPTSFPEFQWRYARSSPENRLDSLGHGRRHCHGHGHGQ